MIYHPAKRLISLGEMAAIVAGGKCLCQRKYDGQLAAVQIGQSVIIAEWMRGEISGHHYTASDRAMFARFGDWFAAITIAECGGVNCLNLTTEARQAMLSGVLHKCPPNVILAETVTDVEAVMASGAEGVVAHGWGDAWGNMIAYKSESIWLCRVTRKGATQSVGIADANTGADLGQVKLGGGKCDQITIGSLIRVAGMGLTDAGKIRQPVACREWLVSI